MDRNLLERDVPVRLLLLAAPAAIFSWQSLLQN